MYNASINVLDLPDSLDGTGRSPSPVPRIGFLLWYWWLYDDYVDNDDNVGYYDIDDYMIIWWYILMLMTLMTLMTPNTVTTPKIQQAKNSNLHLY